MAKPKGSPKSGGRQKGSKNKATLDKEAQLDALRTIVLRELGPMTEAQCQHAKGVSYMVLRHPDGTFARATDQKQIDAACAVGATAFQIFTQAPSTPAFSDLINRTFGKPPERVEMTGLEGKPLEIIVKKPW